MKAFLIDGHFKDDGAEFSDYIVLDISDSIGNDHESGLTDDDIFFYGITEKDIQEAIYTGESIDDFVITSYKPFIID
jgi:hypothetical protein